jgi:arylmalonate decarboxylase
MYGWRMKLGILTPANNVVIEPEFYRFLPPEVAVYTTRMLTSGTHSLEGLVAMEKSAMRGVEELAATKVDVIVYACLSTSLAKEEGWSEAFIERVHESTGIPATAAALATIEALGAMGIKRVGVGSPFPKKIDAEVAPFMARYGIEVLKTVSLEVSDEAEIGRIPPDAIYRLGKDADHEDAQGVCLMATDIQTLDVVEALERDLGKPVVTTNQAILWKTLQLGGVQPDIADCGRLLRP